MTPSSKCSTEEQTQKHLSHYSEIFNAHGRTARGVDWTNDQEQDLRYDRLLNILTLDPEPVKNPSILDVGCGWGGLYKRCKDRNLNIRYHGIDIVPSMIADARQNFSGATFTEGDVFAMPAGHTYDYVICNGVLTLKLDSSITQMLRYANELIRKMFSLSSRGICFNHMSDKVNYMHPNVLYTNPIERMAWCMSEVSPRVAIDHAYNSLGMEDQRRTFDYILHVFKP